MFRFPHEIRVLFDYLPQIDVERVRIQLESVRLGAVNPILFESAVAALKSVEKARGAVMAFQTLAAQDKVRARAAQSN